MFYKQGLIILPLFLWIIPAYLALCSASIDKNMDIVHTHCTQMVSAYRLLKKDTIIAKS